MTETISSSPMKRVEDWKSRLIDLSRKNNLLYFHKGKRGSLQITQPDQQKIFDALVIKKNQLEFWQPQEETKNPEKLEKTIAKGKGKTKTEPKTAKSALIPATTPDEIKRPTANQLVSGSLNHMDLERVLKNLQSRSLAGLHGTGCPHFACGFWDA